jgi:hypothetical protein
MPCGLWVALPDGDVVFVEEETSAVHREHICLHELAHMICGHRGSHEPGLGHNQQLLPDLAPETVAAVLGRTSYEHEEEREAEAMATVLGIFMMPRGQGRSPSTTVLRELARTLGL